jgi:tRNA A-37 threonylcarbamoyl transferase component Bud32
MRRLAVCFRGDFRSWEHTKDFIFKAYEDGSYDQVDYYICTYEIIVHAYRTVYPIDGHYTTGSRPHPNTLLYETKLDVDSIKKDFEGRNLISVDIIDENTRERSIANQFYLMYKCNIAKRLHEIKNGFRYDCVVSTRPDLLIRNNDYRKYSPGLLNKNTIITEQDAIGYKVQFAQDIQFYAESATMDALTQIYHLFDTNFVEHLHAHLFLAKYLNKTSIAYYYPRDIYSLYRKDGLNHIAIDDDPELKNCTSIEGNWHGQVNLKIPEIINDTITKSNYTNNKDDYMIILSSLVPQCIFEILNPYKRTVSELEKKLSNSEIRNNKLKLICEKSQEIFNMEFLNHIKEKYKNFNIICNTIYSLEHTALILSILDITPYVSKVIFETDNYTIVKELNGFSGSNIYLVKHNENFIVRKVNNIDRNYNKLKTLYDAGFLVPKIINKQNNILDMEYISGLDIKTFLKINNPALITEFIIDTINKFKNTDFGINDYTEIYINDLSWINETHNLPFTSNELIEKLPKYVQSSQYHGDLTFDNIIYKNPSFYMIDAITGNYNSWIFDIAKLRQDLDGKWFIRKSSDEFQSELFVIKKELVINFPEAFDDYIYILMLLRVYKYTKENTKEQLLILSEIKRLWK